MLSVVGKFGKELTLSTLWENSADNKLMIFFIYFPGDNLHEYQILFSEKNKKNISKCRLLNFLPSMQSVKGCEHGTYQLRADSADDKLMILFCRQLKCLPRMQRDNVESCKNLPVSLIFTLC